MKKILLASAVALIFSGCSTASLSKLYDTTKVVYVKGKEVVITNADLLDDETLERLNKLDEVVQGVDEIKEVIEK